MLKLGNFPNDPATLLVVVDDDEPSRVLLTLLESAGFRRIQASDGRARSRDRPRLTA